MEKKLDALQARKEELLKQKAAMQGTNKDTKKSYVKNLSKWGVKSVDELLGIGNSDDEVQGVNTCSSRYAYISQDEKETVRALKEAVDCAIIESQLFGKKVTETKSFNFGVKPITEKAFGISSGDDGYEWIPTGVSSSFIDEFNLDRKVSSLFQDMRMPTNPWKFPVLDNGAVATILGAKQSKSPKDSFSTDSITFDAVKLSNQYCLPEELNEDSAVSMMPVIRSELAEGMEKAVEIAIINGDSSALHQDSNSIFGAGAPAADSSERAWDGLRKRALQAGAPAQEDAGNAEVQFTQLKSLREKMGKFAVNPKDLAIICSPKVYYQLLNLDQVTTLEKYGSSATILSGELARISGIPVIVSEYMRDDLNASGVNDGVTTDRSSMLLVNRKRFFLGTRRPMQIRVENNQTDIDAVDLVSYMRKDFQGVLKADGSNYSSESSCALLINIA